jgi:hypothetical protein
MLYKVYKVYRVCHVPYVPHVPYIQEGFLRSTVVYLKDLSPYFR